MKKILCALVSVLALTACGASETTAEVQTVTVTSSKNEIASENSPQNNDTDNSPPSAEEKREFNGELIRVTAVEGDVITGEKMSGGRGFGGGRPDGDMHEKGEPPAAPEDGSMPESGEKPEGEPPAEPENGEMAQKGDKNFDSKRPQGETITFTITDSTVMEAESISEGDMITVELNEDGTAASVKSADFPAQREKESVTEQ